MNSLAIIDESAPSPKRSAGPLISRAVTWLLPSGSVSNRNRCLVSSSYAVGKSVTVKFFLKPAARVVRGKERTSSFAASKGLSSVAAKAAFGGEDVRGLIVRLKSEDSKAGVRLDETAIVGTVCYDLQLDVGKENELVFFLTLLA